MQVWNGDYNGFSHIYLAVDKKFSLGLKVVI